MSEQTIIDRVRLELHDTASSFESTTIADGVSNVYELPVEYVSDTGLAVSVNGSTTSNYTLEGDAGVIHLGFTPTVGDEVAVQGQHYEAFSDAEIQEFVETAFSQHTHGVLVAGAPMSFSTLPPVEEYLVAILAVIQALWVLATDSSRNIDIIVPDGVNIPMSERFRQILEIIQSRQAQYNELAALLNVGLGRIQMSTLRRISRTTNRLVPVYVAQEYDDTTFPVRVLPPIDQGL